MSIPASARSGTRLIPEPPEIVPTLNVGSPRTGCAGTSKSQLRQRGDRRRQRVDRVAAELRRGGVGRLALGRGARPQDALVGHVRHAAGRLGDEDRAGAPQRAGRGQVQRALAAGLLGRAQHQLEPGRAAAERRDALGRHHDRGHAALHVARPAAVQPPVAQLAERLDAPRRAAQRHGVEVAGHAQRRPVAREARHHARPPRRVLVERDLEPGGGQPLGEQRRGRPLAAGRVDGVEADELEGKVDGGHRAIIAAVPARARAAPTRSSATYGVPACCRCSSCTTARASPRTATS